jgi:acetylglutamate kinase
MKLTVVKIGGNIIDNDDALADFLREFAKIEGKKILVHGGGKVATDIGRKLGVEPSYVDGRRITDKETLGIVTMVYGGLVNKNIVASLQSLGCNAIGLTGADGNILPAIKRPVKHIDYGFVGDITSDDIHTEVLNIFLRMGLIPVLAPLTHDVKGNILNTNADTIAQEVAKALAKDWNVELIYCFEKKGVLLDAANENSVIARITTEDFAELREKEVVSAGMIPKLENAFVAINGGVKKVIIGHAKELSDLCVAKAGTSII